VLLKVNARPEIKSSAAFSKQVRRLIIFIVKALRRVGL